MPLPTATEALIAAHAAQRPADEVPRGPLGWTHGDFQPLNVLWEAGRVTAVLEWDRLAVRPYAEEVVRTVQVQFTVDDGELDLGGWRRSPPGTGVWCPSPMRIWRTALSRWWWKRLTDFWQLRWQVRNVVLGA